jgi:ATPase subunit of ABC transporter with duplicated ATPase domains
MQTVRKLTTLVLAALIAAPTVALAEGRHVVDPAAISATIAQHSAEQDADRAAVREALAKAPVREMAGRMGLDIDRATAAIDALSPGDLGRAAAAARQVNQQLVGGATTIVITTTTVIIALLIILIIVLAVD